MLISYKFKNYKSFNTEASLELVATPDKTHSKHVAEIHSTSSRKTLRVLRLAALYGGNASGKSNVVNSIIFSKKLILAGTKPNSAISIDQFRLSDDESESSEFEYVFSTENKIFSYKFELSRERVISEDLHYKDNRGKFQKVFSRPADPQLSTFGDTFFSISKSDDSQFFEFIARGTRQNQLLLTEMLMKNIKQLLPVYTWFDETLVVIPAESSYGGLESFTKDDKGFAGFVSKFLASIDTNNFSVRAEDLNVELASLGLPAQAVEDIQLNLEPKSSATINLKGKRYQLSKNDRGEVFLTKMIIEKLTRGGKKVDFELHEESEGTQRLIHLLPAIYTSINSQKVFIIDEIDRRLHPNLTSELLKSFVNSCELTNSQMIFTTHDSNLLDLETLRRDEVWFVDKDKFGGSSLYSLSEFKVRKDLDIEKGYLLGRFGGVQRIKSLRIHGAISDTAIAEKA